MAADFLDTLFKLCDLNNEHKEFIINSLFKYKTDPVINYLCESINKKAEEHGKFLALFKDTFNSMYFVNKSPLIIFCPDNPTSLRVYPNILLSSHINLEALSSMSCQEALKDFIVEYEADMLDEQRKQKWQPIDRAIARIEQHIDMPTAKALTRYVFTDGKLKDNQIRDFADTIDEYRRPMELTFADTPEEFTIMYGSGPHSCMAFSADGKENWAFLNKHNLCPTSWYAYYPHTRGVYAVKNKKVVARTILFKDLKSDKWQHGRLYGTTTDTTIKFQQSLKDIGIDTLISTHTPPADTSFEMPGVPINGKIFGCPWPYFDNITREVWNVVYNATTNIFTIKYKHPKYATALNRTGHLRSTDYATLECTSCGCNIPAKNTLLEVEGGNDTFCSDNCAVDKGYIKVIDGIGNQSYKLPSEEYINIYGTDFTKYTTLKAAYDRGFVPIIEENDVFPEEGEYKVGCLVGQTVNTAHGLLSVPDFTSNGVTFTSNQVPINFKSVTTKRIIFNEEADLLIEA